jgi:NTE family protein
MKIGLALSGGGAKGFFHIGVIKAMERLGLNIDLVAGTSMGSAVGGLYALYPDGPFMEKRFFSIFEKYYHDILALKGFLETSHLDSKSGWGNAADLLKGFYVWNLFIMRPALVSYRPFIRLFMEMFQGFSFTDCKLPLFVTTTDLLTGKTAIINSGVIHKAVMASSSIPGVFPPLAYDNKLLVDGGVLLPLPAKVIKARGVCVIGVNLDPPWTTTHYNNASDVLMAANAIRYQRILEENLTHADCVIAPAATDTISWADFHRAREIADLGEKTVLENEDRLRAAVKRCRLKRIFHIGKTE